MHRRRVPGATRGWRAAMVGGLAFLWGCAALPPNSFLDPTKVGKFGGDVQENMIREVLTPRDTPTGIPNATEPTPADLVPVLEEYRLAKGDVLAVTVDSLLQPGAPYSAQLEINELGEIRLPELGTVRAEGLTEGELEQELVARLREGELLTQPIVQVFTAARRGRRVSVLGNVSRPQPYAITEPDMRLLDLLAMCGDAGPNAKKAYLTRRELSTPASTAVPTPRHDATPPAPTAPARPDTEKYIILPPDGPQTPQPVAMSTSVGLAQDTRPAQDPDAAALQELGSVMAPQRETPTSGPVPGTADDGGFPQLYFDPFTGQFVEAEPKTSETQRAAAEPPAVVDQSLDEPFDWDAVEELPLEQRVIEIDLQALRNGDPRQNIVLRNRDVVYIPVDTGVFYIMGEVNRPGVFAFGGRDISVKQAIATVGGFSPLAWPQRCEIIRFEPGTDKQLTIPVDLDAIFAGRDSDFYLRDGDILNVGTHVAAPFLFVLRNSFRFTYGFGFVYDRNFADKDAVSSKPNPETLQAQRDAARGLPF